MLPKVTGKDEIFFSFAWHFVFFQISAYKKSGQPFWGCPQKDVLFSSLDKWEFNELISLLFQHNHLHDLC